MSTPRHADRAVLRIPLSRILPGPVQPREPPSAESVARLAESIRLHGQLTPLLVREMRDGQYQLISGARRLLALQRLNRPWAEAIALSGSDCDCALIALVENLQREQLHYLDVAAACREILSRYPITQERLAASLSYSPSALANRLRLLKLPEAVRDALRRQGLGERHARALLRLDSEAEQLALIALAAERRMSAVQLEQCVERSAARSAPGRAGASLALRDNRLVINALMDTVRRLSRLGVPVSSRVEEAGDCIQVIVTIPTAACPNAAPPGKTAPAAR